MVMKNIFFYFFTIVLIIILEFLVPWFNSFGLVFVIFIGMFKGPSAGTTLGFFMGLLYGIFTSGGPGIHSFSYALVGFFAGLIPSRIDENNPIIQVMAVGIGMIFASIVSMSLELIFTKHPVWFEFDWSLGFSLFAPLVFWCLSKWWSVWFGPLYVDR